MAMVKKFSSLDKLKKAKLTKAVLLEIAKHFRVDVQEGATNDQIAKVIWNDSTARDYLKEGIKLADDQDELNEPDADDCHGGDQQMDAADIVKGEDTPEHVENYRGVTPYTVTPPPTTEKVPSQSRHPTPAINPTTDPIEHLQNMVKQKTEQMHVETLCAELKRLDMQSKMQSEMQSAELERLEMQALNARFDRMRLRREKNAIEEAGKMIPHDQALETEAVYRSRAGPVVIPIDTDYFGSYERRSDASRHARECAQKFILEHGI